MIKTKPPFLKSEVAYVGKHVSWQIMVQEELIDDWARFHEAERILNLLRTDVVSIDQKDRNTFDIWRKLTKKAKNKNFVPCHPDRT